MMRNRHGGLARMAILAAGIVLALSGCFNLDVKIALDSKALATGTYRIEMTKEVAALVGITSSKSLEDSIFENQDTALPKGSAIRVEETATSYVLTVDIDHAPLADSDMRAEVLPDGNIKFVFKQDGSADASGLGLDMSTGSVTLEIKFPGTVIESSPEFSRVGDDSVSLSTTLDETQDIFAISEPGESGSNSSSATVPIVIGIVLLLLIAAAVIRDRVIASRSPAIQQVNWPKPGE